MRFASSSSSSLQCLLLAAANTETKMSSFRTYPRGGGRRPGRREFCHRPIRGDREAFVTGDSHFRSVQDANYGFRQGDGGNFRNSGGFQGQPYRPPPPFRQPQPFHPPGSKPWDYRKWEYALSQPPSHRERFIVLSYNILADYLAQDHRRELYYHIPAYVLDWEWRKQKILFELGLWSPDIMCLQEVDRFQDLENELKVHGFDGIWKMRTGKPVDGCAIFWRTTRFKLRHEESIEFRDLGLRDNVAQICVFESRIQKLADNVSAYLPTSSSDVNQVVICNTHVLYNPRRGEIKLGQVRVVLERAHAVSKLWNDAPVVMCGDFNCTPKSPLYNFISEQRLNLAGLARDQISGQSSAEIYRPTKPYNDNLRAQSPNNSVGEKVNVNHISDMHNHHKPHGYVKNSSLMKNLAQPQRIGEVVDTPLGSGSNRQYENENRTICDTMTKEKKEEMVDGSKNEFVSPHYDSLGQMKENPRGYHEEGVPSVDVENGVQEHTDHLEIELGHAETSSASTAYIMHGISYKPSQSKLSTSSLVIETIQNESVCDDMQKENLEMKEKAPSSGSDVYCIDAGHNEKPVNASVTGICDDIEVSSPEIASPSNSCQSTYDVEIADASTCINLTVDQNLGNLSLRERGEVTEEDGSLGQDHASTFTSDSYNIEDVSVVDVVCGSNFTRLESAEADQSSEECSSTPQHIPPPSAEDQNDFSPSFGSEPANMERYIYDPYLWTPMEIETASGNPDCTFLEHPLKLKSTYAEVEDYSGTRDSESKEPQVTSYNRRFLGTVDYIWCSEGLQTVKVLDTIPKQALQWWTTGFPTKKWGSDHIALASQLAFKKDADPS